MTPPIRDICPRKFPREEGGYLSGEASGEAASALPLWPWSLASTWEPARKVREGPSLPSSTPRVNPCAPHSGKCSPHPFSVIIARPHGRADQVLASATLTYPPAVCRRAAAEGYEDFYFPLLEENRLRCVTKCTTGVDDAIDSPQGRSFLGRSRPTCR